MQRKIKVKNFGPIRAGNKANDGWIDIHKVTVFIGDQGSGKSTVAKLISVFTWLEKALIRGDKMLPLKENTVLDLLAYHRLQNYIEQSSELEYRGRYYHLKLVVNDDKYNIEAVVVSNDNIVLPKVMYVPAERNVLSSIENITQVSNLVAGSLQTYLIEYRYAQLENKDQQVSLPINKANYLYDSSSSNSYVILNDKRLKVTEASSGFHSVVPLYLVTDYLAKFIKQDIDKLISLLSASQQIRRKEHISASLGELTSVFPIVFSALDEEAINSIESRYICRSFINIVEEPEQNLFPKSQRLVLNKLVAYNNENEHNQLVLTTHSPYLINYLTLAIEAGKLVDKAKDNKEILDKINDIVPLESVLKEDDVVVYQLNEDSGIVEKLATYKGLPTDDNYLNNSLEEINVQFSELLDIEDLCQ
ncbi:AAA family ATPase [Myroides marinus]|uniref:AAA family ATPase n=1 Tax=Myroides marinus TaxID=703342 RepID=UPI00257712E3|nr:AAA family ATPase [Myroides marinus]MDM1367572.1 AAA family ATPase [Myroides marinus]MDM1371761.1 AAA family ATPase [Myroides marinus]MDM1374741.1 AAA family ATPase [Myroides marinus]MDM1382246.1 AAA family ATPase [Myroides marinus]MDM1389419.1 AAA family ATPase [Myroides marinus]